MTIKNKTKRPLKVPLPGGKRLFLSPGKTGEINGKDAEYPPLVALLEAGDLEFVGKDGGFLAGDKRTGSAGPSGQGHSPGKQVFRSGDS